MDTASNISDSMLDDESLSVDASSDSQYDSSNTDTESEVLTEIQEDGMLDDIEQDSLTLPDASIIPEDVDCAPEDADEHGTDGTLFSLEKGQTFSSWSQADK